MTSFYCRRELFVLYLELVIGVKQIFKNANLLKITELNLYTTCLFIIKYLNNQLPDVCKCFLVVNNPNNAVYDFRTISKFVIPKYRTNIR